MENIKYYSNKESQNTSTDIKNIKYYTDKENKNTCVDIDILDEKETSFTFQECKCFLLKNVNKTFPNIKTIFITSEVKEIYISNFMFPNVRKVISLSDKFVSAVPYLVYNDTYRKILLNSFCLNKYETLNLDNIVYIDKNALEGCKTKKIINYDDVYSFVDVKDNIKKCNANFAITDLNGYTKLFQKNNIVNANGFILKVDYSDCDVLDIPKSENSIIASINRTTYLKKLILHNFNVNAIFKIACDTLYLAEDFECKSLNKYLTITKKTYNNIEIDKNNPNFIIEDGIIFNKNKTVLISFPNTRTGFYKIPDSVERIDCKAFYKSQLTEIDTSKNLKTIDSGAFAFSNISKIKFYEGLKIIEKDAFKYSEKIEEIDLPNSLDIIYENAFYSCKKLKSLHIKKDLSIFSYAFENCYDLKSLDVNFSFSYVSDYGFPSVKNINVDKKEYLKDILDNLDVLLFAGSYPSQKYYGCLTINYKGKQIFIPKHIKNKDVDKIKKVIEKTNDIVDVFDLDVFDDIHLLAIDGISKMDTAINIYKKNKNDSIKTYIRKQAKKYIKECIKNKNEKNICDFIDMKIISEKTLKDILNLVQEANMDVATAYILKSLENVKKTESFRL